MHGHYYVSVIKPAVCSSRLIYIKDPASIHQCIDHYKETKTLVFSLLNQYEKGKRVPQPYKQWVLKFYGCNLNDHYTCYITMLFEPASVDIAVLPTASVC